MSSFIVDAVGQKWILRSSHRDSAEADSIFIISLVSMDNVVQHFTQNSFTYEPNYCNKLNSEALNVHKKPVNG